MYTAIIGRNFRDVYTSSPTVLLRNIHQDGVLFRDHCWVKQTNELLKFIPYKNHQELVIQFDAKPLVYQTRGDQKTSLTQLTNIKIIKRIHKCK